MPQLTLTTVHLHPSCNTLRLSNFITHSHSYFQIEQTVHSVLQHQEGLFPPLLITMPNEDKEVQGDRRQAHRETLEIIYEMAALLVYSLVDLQEPH